MKESRSSELNLLKTKILEAIKGSKQFWMTFRKGTYGIASIINLIYKKSYIEVLFYPNGENQNGKHGIINDFKFQTDFLHIHPQLYRFTGIEGMFRFTQRQFHIK